MPIVVLIRIIKSQKDLLVARHVEEVASAIMVECRDSIKGGIPKFEVDLAIALHLGISRKKIFYVVLIYLHKNHQNINLKQR